MDISPSYNCLLGRSWIHIAGAVPSTLHQKIKFIIEGKLICIAAEEDMIAATSSATPYVETDEKALECSFRSLEFVNVMYVGEGLKVSIPKLSDTTHAGIKAIARQRSPNWKRIRKKATRHANANSCDPEKG